MPMRCPTPKVTAAARPPAITWRTPERSADRPLRTPIPAPTANTPARKLPERSVRCQGSLRAICCCGLGRRRP